jgi:NitT/TauT family transport system substrate-binding protein
MYRPKVTPAIRTMTAIAGLMMLSALPSSAQTLRIAKSPDTTITYTPLDVGIRAGLFKELGLSLEISGFGGDARLAQAAVADAFDIGFGGAATLGFEIKGTPVTAVASIMDTMAWLSLQVPANSPIKSLKDLRGKKVAVPTPGSLTVYVLRDVERRMNWPRDSIQAVSLGSPTAMYAGMKAGQVDALVTALDGGYGLEARGEGRNAVNFGPDFGKFHSLIIYASNTMIKNHPDQLKSFLKGWLQSVAYTQKNKDKSLPAMMAVTHPPEPVVSRSYDELASAYSTSGRFDPAAIKREIDSLVELGIVDRSDADSVKLSDLYTGAFLPN